jgi:intermediate cleaving peptidase 55
VVAAGENGGVIHYIRNDSLVGKDEIILVDAGAQYGGYITDISRTWPNGGKFSPAQRDLYLAVLDVQRDAIKLCTEEKQMSLDKIHSITERKLKENLKDLGFDMSGNALINLFPHHIGHYIGLDVHDSPGYLRSETLVKGMCVTIEP